jgi:tripartite-type tricarboxylate transporter receptor subunit TctC
MKTFALIGLVSSLALLASPALAQRAEDWPARPIRIVMSGSPGGSTDVITRAVTAKLTERWGQAFLVENMSGASGAIAAETAAKAPPNGYTLYALSSSSAVAAAVGQTTNVNFRTAYAPIINMVSQPYVVVINAGLPVMNVRELVATARSQPGKLTYASLGVGSATHLGMELFKSIANVDILHIPYKGTNQAELALVAGQVNILLGGALSAMPLVKAGKTRALAVTGLARSRLLPDLPTVADAGLPGYELEAWFGLAAPAATPIAIIQKVHADAYRVLNLPEIRDKLTAGGSEVVPSESPAAFAQHLYREMDKWERFMKVTGIKL